MRMRMIAVAWLAMAAALLAGCPKRPESGPPVGLGVEPGTATSAAAAPRVQTAATVSTVRDVHFETDRAEIRPGEARALEADTQWLRANPAVHIRVEGYADERGTGMYNRALGTRRATAVRDYLVARGIHAQRLTIVSFGPDRPLCTERSAACLARNRRVHLAVRPSSQARVQRAETFPTNISGAGPGS